MAWKTRYDEPFKARATAAPPPIAHERRKILAALGTAVLGLAAGPMLARPAARPRTDPLVFSGPIEPGDRRFDFPAALLQLALERAGSRRRVVIAQGMPETRLIAALAAGERDIGMLPNIAAAQSARHVPIPLRRGLLGVRLLLARPEVAEQLMLVENAEALKRQFLMGYGHQWADGSVFESLGFRMEYGASYSGLFEMLRAGRFDYLSRGINELQAERADGTLAGRDLVVVPGIALFYPLDDYFCVRADEPELQATLATGLRRALADGSYARLFGTHYGAAIRDARIEERSVLHVLGYPVPPGTPLEQFDVLQLVSSRGALVPPT